MRNSNNQELVDSNERYMKAAKEFIEAKEDNADEKWDVMTEIANEMIEEI